MSNETALLSVHQLATMLAARWRLVLITMVSVVAAAGGLTMLSPRTWTASADVYIDYRENDPISGRNFSALLDDSYMQTQIDMIKSQVVAEKVINQLNLGKVNEAISSSSARARARENLLANVARKIEVSNKRGSRVLEVAFTADSPEHARDIIETVVNSYVKLSQQVAGQAARSRSEQYGIQLEQLRAEADAIQTSMTKFQREAGILKSRDQDVDTRKLEQMELDLSQLQTNKLEAQARSSNTTRLVERGARADDLPEVSQSGVVMELKSKLNDVNRRLTEAKATLGDRHPVIIGLVDERQELRSRLGQITRTAIDSQKSDRSRLSQQEAALNKEITAQRDKVLRQLQGRDRLASYERQLAGVQQIYTAAVQKYDGLLMAGNITMPGVSVLRQPELPAAPSGPKWSRNLIAGFGVGMLSGIMLAFLLELAKRRVRSQEDMIRGLGLPLLGTIGNRGSRIA